MADTTDDGADVRSGRPRSGAWRVTFEQRGERLRVIAQERVDTLPPPDDSEAVAGATAGHWVEVLDADGATLYRQIVNVPLADQREVFSADGSLRRVETDEPLGHFQVLVPDLPAGHEIVLRGRAASSEVSRGAAGELVRAVLREQRAEGR